MEKQLGSAAGYVLVHGGGMGAWIWERLTPLLRLPGRAVEGRLSGRLRVGRHVTIGDCVEYLVSEIDKSGFEQVILVGHSIGGVLLPGAAALKPRVVRHLVFVAASVPPEGGRGIDVMPRRDRILNRVAILLQKLGVTPPPEALERMIREHFCNDSSEDVVREVLSHPVLREPECLAFERVSRKSMPPVPTTYVRLLRDGTASLEALDRMAASLPGAAVRSIEADHMVMLSKPEALAAVLDEAASGLERPGGDS